jgi:hypothetical protein
MKGTTALTKIRIRTKQLQKKHPSKKYRTLQKQAAGEYRAGSIPKARKKSAPKKKARSKRRKVGSVAKLGTRYKVYHEVKKVGKRKRKRSTAGKPAKRKVVTRTRTVTKYRRVGKAGMSTATKIAIGVGLVAAAYLLLKKPSAVSVPGVPVALVQTGNTARDTYASSLLQYAQAGGAGITALTNLINSLNGMNDAAVVSNYQMVQQGGDINTLLALPTGGPSINIGG